MKLNTYLNFDGDCRAAFEFYAQLLGGKIAMMMSFAESPGCDGMPAQALDKIMHARLVIGDDLLMGTDATPEYPHQGINGAHVTINVGEPAEADRIFAALAEGGKVELPIQETFWAKRYGIAVDRFGVPWMVNCEQAA
ncbi:MAG: VOC family protein [Luteimonas sp.]|nr:VOC family protein [Luteimonas sp.]